jgi:hypothetical protein
MYLPAAHNVHVTFPKVAANLFIGEDRKQIVQTGARERYTDLPV